MAMRQLAQRISPKCHAKPLPFALYKLLAKGKLLMRLNLSPTPESAQESLILLNYASQFSKVEGGKANNQLKHTEERKHSTRKRM